MMSIMVTSLRLNVFVSEREEEVDDEDVLGRVSLGREGTERIGETDAW